MAVDDEQDDTPETPSASPATNPFDTFDTPVKPQGSNPFDQFDTATAPTSSEPELPQTSMLGAAGSGFVRGVGPAAGAIAGAKAGALIGTAIAPEFGGTLIGGIGGALVGGALGAAGQETLMSKLGLTEGGGILSDQYAQAAEKQHPYAQFAGSLAPLAAAFTTGNAETAMVSRVLSGGIFSATEGAQEFFSGENVDPTKIAMAGAAGAILPTERPWLSKIAPLHPVQAKEGKAIGRPNVPEAPTAQADREDAAQNDLTLVSRGMAQENVPVKDVPVQTAANTPERDAGNSGKYQKVNPVTEKAGIPGAPTQEGITFTDAPSEDVAAALAANVPNSKPVQAQPSQPTLAPAPEPPPAPIQTGIDRRIQELPGNWQRRAGEQPLRAQQGQLGEAFQPEPPQIAGNPLAEPGMPAARQGALPQEDVDLLVKQGSQIAMRRPIVSQAMPSIANSSKDLRGPVVIDPAIPQEFHRPLAVHETVEQILMARGMPYEQAHPIATQAEKAAVERDDIDWKTYTEKVAGAGESIEKQKVDPQTYAGMDLHVDPEQAIGHHVQKATELGDIPTQEPIRQPLSPKQQDIIDRLSKLEGGKEAAEALATKPDDHPSWEKASKYVYSNAPELRHTVGEGEAAVQTGGGARGARKEAATAAVKSAFEKFKPGEDEDDQALLDRAKAAVTHAQEQYNGKNPVDRKEGYAPRVKSEAWQFVKRAQDLIKNPSDAAIEKFRTDEGLWRGGGGADVQATKRIEADIDLAKRPTSEVAEQANAAETTEQAPRHDFEMMEPWKPGADESKPYIEDSNAIRTWINNLDDTDYRLVEGAYPDIRQVVETAGDPRRLQLQMESDLEGAQMRRPGVIEPITPEEAPTAKRVRVTKAADITEPGAAASAGRSRKDLIAEYNAKLKAGELPTGNKLSPEERLAAEQKAQGGVEPIAPKETPEPGIKEETHLDPVTGAEEGETAESTLQKFMKDESGALSIGPLTSALTPANLSKFKNWLANGDPSKLSEHFMAAAPKSALEKAARDTSEFLHTMTQRLTDYKLKLIDEAKGIPGTFTASDMRDTYRAMEQGKVSTLAPQQQAFVRTVLEPMRAFNRVMYDALRRFDPDQYPETDTNHMPRRIVGTSDFDEKSGAAPDPVEGIKRVLTTEPAALKDRNYMSLEDATGKRFVVEPDTNGRIKVWQGGKYKIYKAPDYEAKIGKQIDVAGKQYIIKDAYAQEITRNALLKGKPIQYHENSFATLANDSAHLFDALQNVQFLERMKSDPRFKYDPKTKTGGATTNYEVAKQLGWEKSELPQFKEWFMSPEYRRVFDQFAQPGVKGLNWIRNLSQAVTKTMFWLPTAHLDNVFQHWIIARGSGWLSTSGYARLAKTLPEAIKSVMAQDKIQSDMRGVNSDRAAGTVYGGVLAGDFHKTIAEASMMDMYKNPSKWDPVTKALGIDLPTFARKVYGVSKAVMWSGNDMMLTQLYLENKMKGMSHAKAIVNAETHFPNYRLPSTIMGSENLRRGLEDPVALSFGRYHYGMVNSYTHIAKELAYGDKNTKVEAMAKIAVLGAMGFVAYPIMNSMVKSVTGNPGAEMQPRGPFAIPAHIIKALQGKEDAAAALRSTLTVSPLLSTALETLHNTDWRGKPIVEPGEMAKAGHGNVKSIGRAILQQGEHAVRGLVSPVNTAELMAARPESAVGSLAAQLADIKNPTPAANRFAAKQPSINQKNAQARFKKPPGMLESVYNKLVGQ